MARMISVCFYDATGGVCADTCFYGLSNKLKTVCFGFFPSHNHSFIHRPFISSYLCVLPSIVHTALHLQPAALHCNKLQRNTFIFISIPDLLTSAFGSSM